MLRPVGINFLIVVGVFHNANEAAAQKFYWADPAAGTIQRADLDGSDVETLIHRFSPKSVAVDPVEGKVYWTDFGSRRRIQRSNYDGANVESIFTDLSGPDGLAVHATARRLYWSDSIDGSIRSAELDGTDTEIVVEGLASPRGITLDESNGQLYWAEYGTDLIRRSALDGSSIETVLITPRPERVALDFTSGRIYWIGGTISWPTLKRANLDGTEFQAITTAPYSPIDFVLDLAQGSVYWSSRRPGEIHRANLDGTSLETLIRPESSEEYTRLQGIAIDQDNRIFWADAGLGQIVQADLNVLEPQFIVAEASANPYSLALDIPNGFIYWSAVPPYNPGFFRSTIDGGETVEIPLEPEEPLYMPGRSTAYDLALNTSEGKMYWATGRCVCDDCSGMPMAWRGNLDGSETESLISFQSFISWLSGIALDRLANRVYWIDRGGEGITCDTPARIQRANLDGTNLEDLIISDPWQQRNIAIDLDLVHEKMYWTHQDPPGIKRANLDGTNEETILALADGKPEGLAVDPIGKSIYWIDAGADSASPGTIYRMDLDGSNVAALVSTTVWPTSPSRIALDRDPLNAGGCCDTSAGECTNRYAEDCTNPEATWTPSVYCAALEPQCDCDPVCPVRAEPSGANKSRFISFTLPPAASGSLTAIRVRLAELNRPFACCDPNAPGICGLTTCLSDSSCSNTSLNVCAPSPAIENFALFEGEYRFVNTFGDNTTCVDSGPQPFYRCARLGCSPEYRDWAAELGTSPLHVTGSAVVPGSLYGVTILAATCKGVESTCPDVSTEYYVRTAHWGDITGQAGGLPDGKTNVLDISIVVDKLKGLPNTPIEPRVWMRGNSPNPVSSEINVLDLSLTVDVVRGARYEEAFSVEPCF